MRNWIACLNFLILFLSLALLLCLPFQSQSQPINESNFYADTIKADFQFRVNPKINYFRDTTRTDLHPNLPNPNSVMFKSMIIPGWGQIVNKQVWKVPLVYGILGGLGYYSVYLTKQYHDYRAAYYNLNPRADGELPTDQRFGPTPSYIPEDANLQELRSIRNTYRNRRDLVYVGVVLAYGLNIIDAYVFAHMRSFDVSKDLSMRAHIQPGLMAQATPGITLTIDLISK